MSNEVKINKMTAFLLAGVFLAVLIGGYIVFANGQQPQAPANPGQVTPPAQAGGSGEVQDIYLKATANGYDKSELVVRKGIPVRLHFTAIKAGCGSQLVIYGMNVKAISTGKETVVEFTPQKEGTFEYNCGMRMFDPGKFVVTA